VRHGTQGLLIYQVSVLFTPDDTCQFLDRSKGKQEVQQQIVCGTCTCVPHKHWVCMHHSALASGISSSCWGGLNHDVGRSLRSISLDTIALLPHGIRSHASHPRVVRLL
jgi:hypothetical protein